MRAGTGLQQPWAFAELPAGDPVQLSLVDYAGRAAYEQGRSLGDRRVTVTGFLAFDDSGEPYLTRMILNCCAADAQPVKIGLSGQIPPVLQPDSWLEVTGTYTGKQTADPINGGPIPFIDVSQARPVSAPVDEYENW
jgi:putative membrane protein